MSMKEDLNKLLSLHEEYCSYKNPFVTRPIEELYKQAKLEFLSKYGQMETILHSIAQQVDSVLKV